eukprot:1182483-Prorocentrum_minimum.AAC.1
MDSFDIDRTLTLVRPHFDAVVDKHRELDHAESVPNAPALPPRMRVESGADQALNRSAVSAVSAVSVLCGRCRRGSLRRRPAAPLLPTFA